MKLREIFRFELAYQIRRPWPWLAFVVVAVFSFMNTRVGIVPVTLPKDFILNSPFIIASVTVISCLIWLMVAPAIPGEAGARDVQTGMHALTYILPVDKTEYLGGRFLAAFALNAFVLLGAQVGSLLAAYAPGVDPAIIGPFRPASYLAAYAYIALPNALIATTLQFSVALFSGRSMTSYFGSVVLLFFTVPVPLVIYFALGQPKVALLADPIGMFAIMNEMMSNWTIVEKNVRMFTLSGPMLWNRLLWLAIALATLAVIHRRFRFAHRVPIDPWSWIARRFGRRSRRDDGAEHPRPSITVPDVRQSFGIAIHLRQARSIAWSSFRMIATSPAGLFLLVLFPMFAALVVVVESEHWGVPLLPRTGYILSKYLTAPLTYFSDFRVVVPLITVYFAGEVAWRERDARISDTVDATSVPEWVLFLGKYLGLCLVLAALMVSLSAAAIVAQLIRGYHDVQPALLLKILFGLQLPEYLLFALLAFVIQAVVSQKQLAQLLAIVAYFLIIFAPRLGIEHKLLIYGAGPGWTYTDMRGFGSTVAPWAWSKLYWAAWALLLAVAARVLWVRGREPGVRTRLRIARGRLTRATLGAAAVATTLVAALGGFVFYNTNVLNTYRTDAESTARQAEYERRYGRYEGIAQPKRVATSLRVEIHPDRRAATIRGSFRLVNRDSVAIGAVHVEPPSSIPTRITFDRAASRTTADEELGHCIYTLREPLQPGDSLTLGFEVDYAPRGFSHGGAPRAVVANGTYFTSAALPAIGYQARRELTNPDERRKNGLPRQVTLPNPGDIDPHVAAEPAAVFDAVVGTDADQVAVAPGVLRRTWTEGGRRYFHYGSDVPISGDYVFFSADYAVHRERWNDVELSFFNHPDHTANRDRVVRSARASLAYYSAQFGEYPYRFLQVVEQPGNFFGMGVDGSGVVTGGEGFYLLAPRDDRRLDAVFEIVAHEMAHQWWGVQLKYAFAEGAGVVSESLAWYSAMQLVKTEQGRERLRQFMSFMREPNPWPPMRTGLPLLRAMDPWAGYRKGPYALTALAEYIGADRVNGALRRLLASKIADGSLATTLDLYRELQAATPDSVRPLLHDLFEVNAFWTFDTKRASAVRTKDGSWEVTLDVEARKVIADSAGVERDAPMIEAIEVGIFAAAAPGEILGEPLHLQKHRIRAGRQTIVVTVPRKPARAGIDPYSLLDWAEGDNIEGVETSAK